MASTFTGMRRTLVALDAITAVYCGPVRPLSRRQRAAWRRLLVWYCSRRFVKYGEALYAAQDLGFEVARERAEGIAHDPHDPHADAALRVRLRHRLLRLARSKPPRDEGAYRRAQLAARIREELEKYVLAGVLT